MVLNVILFVGLLQFFRIVNKCRGYVLETSSTATKKWLWVSAAKDSARPVLTDEYKAQGSAKPVSDIEPKKTIKAESTSTGGAVALCVLAVGALAAAAVVAGNSVTGSGIGLISPLQAASKGVQTKLLPKNTAVQLKNYQYTAKTSQAMKKQGKVRAGNLTWVCKSNACVIKGPWPTPGVGACAALARQVGRILSYGHPSKKLSMSQLNQCNAGVASKQKLSSRPLLNVGATAGSGKSAGSNASAGTGKPRLSSGQPTVSLSKPSKKIRTLSPKNKPGKSPSSVKFSPGLVSAPRADRLQKKPQKGFAPQKPSSNIALSPPLAKPIRTAPNVVTPLTKSVLIPNQKFSINQSLNFAQRNSLRQMSVALARTSSFSTIRSQWTNLIKQLKATGRTIDVNSLVQTVLRQSHIQVRADITNMEKKIKTCNESEEVTLTPGSRSNNSLKQMQQMQKSNRQTTPFVAKKLAPQQYQLKKGQVGQTRNMTVETKKPKPGPQLRRPTMPKKLGASISGLEPQLQTACEQGQLAQIDLQNILQKQQQTMQMMSAISKQLNDTAMAIIRKIGG